MVEVSFTRTCAVSLHFLSRNTHEHIYAHVHIYFHVPLGRAMLDFGKSQEDVKLDSISTTGVMKVKIHSAKNLPAMDRSGLSDPYVLCSVNDDTRKTRVIKSTLNPFWDDEDISHQSHNVDERKGGNDSKISNENKNKKFSRGSEFTFHNVSITDTMHVMVMDWDMLLQDDHIGSFTVDLRSLNMTSGFPMGTSFKKKQWFLLENLPNSSLHLTVEFEYHTLAHSKKVARKLRRRAKRKKRMLRNTVDSMFGSGRENVLPLGSKILGYPSQGQYQLRGRVYLGRNLPACDSSGTSDPFLEMHCCGHSDKTSHKNDTVDPTWNEVLSFNIHTLPEPITMAPYIQVFAYDFDRFSSKDPLGRFKVSCEEARDNYLDYRERCMRKRAKVLEDRRTGGKWERDHDEHSGLPSNLTSPLSSLATKITHTNGTIEQPGASSSSAARDGTRVNEAANISNGSANTTDTINNDHSSHDIANSTGSTNRHTTEILVRTQEFIETHELQLAHKGLEGEHTHTDDEMEFDDELFAEIKPRWYQLYDWHNNIIEGAKILADFQLLTSEEVQEDSVVEDITPVTMPVNLEVTKTHFY